MGWIPKQDEETGVEFALPPPTAGPEDRRRSGSETSVATRAYTARAGEIAFSVQLHRTPDNPEALARELPPRRMPSLAIDQLRSGVAHEAQVVSNERVEEFDHPTYDAHVELSSADEDAIWWMRTHALDGVVLVTQVVVFVDSEEDESRDELRTRGATAFERLNSTVEVPEGLTR